MLQIINLNSNLLKVKLDYKSHSLRIFKRSNDKFYVQNLTIL